MFFFTTTRRRALCLLVLAVLSTITAALQATPNSPCAPLCLNPAGMSGSDTPNISEDDIVCSNRDYGSPQGQKFMGCMNCLQNSTYSLGSQNDQAWFIYNLQYAFAHCVFGYPNGSGIGPYPCMTSEACGPLNITMTKSLANNSGTDPYAYCRYKAGSTLGGTFGKCLDCMRPDTEHGFVANYFVALEAGCEQRPGAHGHLALNDTLFSNTTIGIINPNKPDKNDHDGGGLSTGALIAVVVICVLLGCGLVAACVVLFLRRRRQKPFYNQSALEHAAERHMRHGEPVDFRCAASRDNNPFTPGSRGTSTDKEAATLHENQHHEAAAGTAATGGGSPSNGGDGGGGSVDEKAALVAAAAAAAAAAASPPEKQPRGPFPGEVNGLRSNPPVVPVRNFSHKPPPPEPVPAPAPPSSVDTAMMAGVAKPEKAAVTPSSSPVPYSPDSFVTPSSTTSATPFLAGASQGSGARSLTSPRLKQQQSWDETRRGGLLRSKGSKTDVSAPVASRTLQTTFPPPPKR